MDKNTLSNYGWIVIAVLVLSVMIALATPFGGYIKDAVWSTTEGLFDTSEKALNVVGMSAGNGGFNNETDSTITLPCLSEISSVVLGNTGFRRDGEVNPNRAKMHHYFYIPVNAGTTVNLVNNSKDFRVSLLRIRSSALGYNLGDDLGWCLPGETKSAPITENFKYIGLLFSKTNDGNFDASTINLEDFVVTYEGSEENLLNVLPSMVAVYNKSSLKDYDAIELSNVLNSAEIAGHAAGEPDQSKQNTITTISNAVENKGFTVIELDMQSTSDGELILHHNTTISGLTIKNSTYDELKAVKNDLMTVRECLEYCSANDIFVYFDVKDSGSKSSAEYLISLIEEYNMEDNFGFARCPVNILNNLPEEYQNIDYGVMFNEWKSSYIGKDNAFYTTHYALERYENMITALTSGHKKFALYDDHYFVEDINSNKLDFAIFAYLVNSYDGDFHLTCFNKLLPDISDITEQQLLQSLPKDVWESTGLIIYK